MRLKELKADFFHNILTRYKLRVGVCLRKLESLSFNAIVVFPEERYESLQSLCSIALPPISLVEHVSHFRGSHSSDQADNARVVGGFGSFSREQFDREIPSILAIVATLDPFLGCFNVVCDYKRSINDMRQSTKSISRTCGRRTYVS